MSIMVAPAVAPDRPTISPAACLGFAPMLLGDLHGAIAIGRTSCVRLLLCK